MVTCVLELEPTSGHLLGSIPLRGMIKRKEQAQMILVAFVLASWPHSSLESCHATL